MTGSSAGIESEDGSGTSEGNFSRMTTTRFCGRGLRGIVELEGLVCVCGCECECGEGGVFGLLFPRKKDFIVGCLEVWMGVIVVLEFDALSWRAVGF